MAKRAGVLNSGQPTGWARQAVLGLAGLAAVGLVLGACSTSGDESSGGSTTVATTEAPATTAEAPATTETSEATTTTAGDDAPTTTVADGPTETPTPSGTPSTPEELAVAFVRAASTGEDLSSFVHDPAVIAEAAPLEVGPEAAGWEFSMEPDYVDPNSQAGTGGDCQLIGDVTLTCAVLIGRPATDEIPDPSFSLYAVLVTNIHPEATDPSDPRPPVPYYVVGIQGLAG